MSKLKELLKPKPIEVSVHQVLIEMPLHWSAITLYIKIEIRIQLQNECDGFRYSNVKFLGKKNNIKDHRLML